MKKERYENLEMKVHYKDDENPTLEISSEDKNNTLSHDELIDKINELIEKQNAGAISYGTIVDATGFKSIFYISKNSFIYMGRNYPSKEKLLEEINRIDVSSEDNQEKKAS